jgi:hypothetical protein
MLRLFCAFFLALLVLSTDAGFAKSPKPMTSQDVINLVQAKISQDSILLAIEKAKPAFDTSSSALINLNKHGVPDAVVQAMMRAEDQPAATPSRAIATPGRSSGFNPEEVILLEGSQRTVMHYITPEIRTATRALGLGGVSSYAVLRGATATLRTMNKQPSFLVAVPNNAQPQTYFDVASIQLRKNGTREISIGGGYMSYSSGLPKDRIIEVKYDRYADQSRAPSGFTIYNVVPTAPMSDGEYAMIVHSAQVHTAGFFGGGSSDSFFDFRVGPPE